MSDFTFILSAFVSKIVRARPMVAALAFFICLTAAQSSRAAAITGNAINNRLPLFVCSLGMNLIANGEAEADSSAIGDGSDIDVSDWNPESGQFTVVRYSAANFLTASSPGPADRGNFYFAGGSSAASSSGTQTLDVSGCSTQIDAGNQQFSLSGFLGGYINQNDNARLTVTFRDAGNASLGTAAVGPVLAADRSSATGLFSRTVSGTIPVGTRIVEVVLLLTRNDGLQNDGYADNLSFMLTAPTAATVSVGGRVTTADGRGIGGIRLSLTGSEGNPKTATTDAFGYYRFEDLQVGATYILSASGKHFTFSQPTQVLSINDETDEVNFIAVLEKRIRVF